MVGVRAGGLVYGLVFGTVGMAGGNMLDLVEDFKLPPSECKQGWSVELPPPHPRLLSF